PASARRETRSRFEEFSLSSFQRVIKRMNRNQWPGLVGNAHRQNSNAFVVGQRQCSRARRQIDRVSKQIRIGIRFSVAGGVASLRTEPGDVGALDEPWSQANHLAVNVRARAHWCSGRRVWPEWNWFFSCSPNAIVPLANKASPFLNCQVRRFRSDAKRRSLICVCGCGEQIDSIE